MKKEFILRTESVISSEKATQAFDGNNDVTIPMCILEDLYRYQGNPEKKIIASKFGTSIPSVKKRTFDKIRA